MTILQTLGFALSFLNVPKHIENTSGFHQYSGGTFLYLSSEKVRIANIALFSKSISLHAKLSLK